MSGRSLAITWLGHSTVLIEVGGVRLLTDPVLRPRVAHLTRRVAEVEPSSLAPLDGVLLSHVHRDHLDVPTLRQLDREVPVVGPHGAAALIRDGRTVHGLEPGQELEVAGVTVRATPAIHQVRRGFRDVAALGFVVDDRVYFAGDTDVFGEMAGLGAIDTALLPVWGWGTKLGAGHMDPPAAAEAAALIGPRTAVPIHWGTYFPMHTRPEGPPAAARPAARLREPGWRAHAGHSRAGSRDW